jgi:2-polyprenyl-3-methyl-5-hydroxy-6-metoxy-1,4-benzoquinol methylase
MRRTLAEYEQEWERNAKLDPFFAILGSKDCKHGRWDIDEFFRTGRAEIDLTFRHLEKIGAQPATNGRFLDVGCGVGRLSRALILRFPRGVAIDISSRMIKLAEYYSTNDPVKVEYITNKGEDLSQIKSASISFLYCHLVLQHMPNELEARFIGEFCRVLEPGGIAAFQILVGSIPREGGAVAKLRSWLSRALPQPIKAPIKAFVMKIAEMNTITMEMNCLPEITINNIIANGGVVLEKLEFSNSAELGHKGNIEFFSREEAIRRILDGRARSNFLSAFYFVRKISGA